MVDAGRDIIDAAIVQHGGKVYRFSKHEDRGASSLGIYQQVGSGLFAEDFQVVERGIGAELHADLEAPILVEAPDESAWYLFLDRYGAAQGYTAMQTDDLASGRWTPVPEGEFDVRPATKHGTILSLARSEWERLRPFA
jgi:hypothetical protein